MQTRNQQTYTDTQTTLSHVFHRPHTMLCIAGETGLIMVAVKFQSSTSSNYRPTTTGAIENADMRHYLGERLQHNLSLLQGDNAVCLHFTAVSGSTPRRHGIRRSVYPR